MVLDNGTTQTCGPPSSIFEQPPTEGVTRLLGCRNVWTGKVDRRWPQICDAKICICEQNTRGGLNDHRTSTWVIRAEHVEVRLLDDDVTFDGIVTDLRYRGTSVKARISGPGIDVVVSIDPSKAPTIGSRVGIHLPPQHLIEVAASKLGHNSLTTGASP